MVSKIGERWTTNLFKGLRFETEMDAYKAEQYYGQYPPNREELDERLSQVRGSNVAGNGRV